MREIYVFLFFFEVFRCYINFMFVFIRIGLFIFNILNNNKEFIISGCFLSEILKEIDMFLEEI